MEVAGNIACVGCDSPKTVRLGPLPKFARSELDLSDGDAWVRTSLYRCADCELRFRWPMPTQDELEHYYQIQSGDDRWNYQVERPVWKSINRQLASVPMCSVLDVGCFRGDLLDF